MSETLWWKIAEHADEACKLVSIGERNVYVRGRPGFITVVELPAELPPGELQGCADAAMRTLHAYGINSAIIVPRGVRFVKLEPADPTVHALLEEREQMIHPQPTQN